MGSASLAVTAARTAAGLAAYVVPLSIDHTDTTDVTASLNTWLAGVPDNSHVVFPAGGSYRIEGTLLLSARTGVSIDGAGCTFHCHAAPTESQPMWTLADCTNVDLSNMTLTASYASPGTFTSAVEHAHGIAVLGSGFCDLSSITMNNFAGDGIYYGLSTTGSHVRAHDCTDTDCSVLGTGRNGISYVACSTITSTRTTVNTIGLYGFDVEPNTTAYDAVDHVTITTPTIHTCRSFSFAIVENNTIDSITFTGATCDDANGLKIQVTDVLSNPIVRPTNVTLTNNTGTAQGNPFGWSVKHVDGLVVTGNQSPVWCSANPSYAMLISDCSGLTYSANTTTGSGGTFNPPAGFALKQITVRLAGITASTAPSLAQVRIGGITASTTSGSSAVVRIAEITADAPIATYVWDGTSWLLSTPPTTGLSQAHAVSGGSGMTTTGPSAVSIATARSAGSTSVSSGAGTLALSGTGALVVSGGAIGITGKVGEIDFSGIGTLTLRGNAAQGPVGFGSVSVFTHADASPPYNEIDLTGFLGTTAALTRIDQAGNRTPVRLANPASLDGGSWFGSDFEAPYGVPCTYQCVATLTQTSDPVVLDVSTPWLIHPGVPTLSQPLLLAAVPVRTYESNQGVHNVLGRSTPIVVTDGARRAATLDLTVRTETVSAALGLEALIADTQVLLLQIRYVEATRSFYEWVAIGQAASTSMTDFFGDDLLSWTLGITVTTSPDDANQGERTLAALAAEFSTLGEIEINYATLADIIADNLIGS